VSRRFVRRASSPIRAGGTPPLRTRGDFIHVLRSSHSRRGWHLDWIASKTLPPGSVPDYLRTGQRGEEHAYVLSSKTRYTMIAHNFRSPNRRGEIDLIGWCDGILCFVEVKTRTPPT
jgi:hypothetical protein